MCYVYVSVEIRIRAFGNFNVFLLIPACCYFDVEIKVYILRGPLAPVYKVYIPVYKVYKVYNKNRYGALQPAHASRAPRPSIWTVGGGKTAQHHSTASQHSITAQHSTASQHSITAQHSSTAQQHSTAQHSTIQ